jgi:hypothetical protein
METERHCSFCNKPEHKVAKLVPGPDVNICDSCVRIATQIIERLPPGPSALGRWRDQAGEFLVRLVRPLRRMRTVG